MKKQNYCSVIVININGFQISFRKSHFSQHEKNKTNEFKYRIPLCNKYAECIDCSKNNIVFSLRCISDKLDKNIKFVCLQKKKSFSKFCIFCIIFEYRLQ